MIGIKQVDGKWWIVFVQPYKIGQKLVLPKFELPVLVLHGCPLCYQVIRVYFKTDRFIPAWKYCDVEREKDWDMIAVSVSGGMGIIDKGHVKNKICPAVGSGYYQTYMYPYFDIGASLEEINQNIGGETLDLDLVGKVDERVIPILKKYEIKYCPDFAKREAPLLLFNVGHSLEYKYGFAEVRDICKQMFDEIKTVLKR